MTPTKKNTRRKVVKAWTIAGHEEFQDVPEIFKSKASAQRTMKYFPKKLMEIAGISIVPCTISYSLPATPRRPK